MNSSEILVLIGSNGHVYLSVGVSGWLFEIKGSFQKAVILSTFDDVIKVAAFSRGTIFYYIIKRDGKNDGFYQLLKISDMDIHLDDVTFVYQKGK